MLPRLPEWQIAMVGAIKLGAIPIPCIDMLTPGDVAYRIRPFRRARRRHHCGERRQV